MSTSSATTAVLLAVAAGLCWGIGEVCTKAVLHTHKVGPMAAIALRSAVALPVILAAWLIAWKVVGAPKEAPGLSHATPREWALLLGGSGLVAGALAMICFYWALSIGDVSRIKPVAFSIAPATGVLLGWLILKEAMTLQKALGVGLILLGVVVLTLSKARPMHP
jgi:uncharacterized membrane protein